MHSDLCKRLLYDRSLLFCLLPQHCTSGSLIQTISSQGGSARFCTCCHFRSSSFMPLHFPDFICFYEKYIKVFHNDAHLTISFSPIKFWLMYFETMLLGSYKFRNCYIFLMNWTFYYYQKYLYFWQWFLIKIYFDIYVAISPFFWLVFVWCIFSILLLSVFLCPYIWDSYKYLWIGFVFCFYSAYNLCLLREVFTTYIFVNDIFIYIYSLYL